MFNFLTISKKYFLHIAPFLFFLFSFSFFLYPIFSFSQQTGGVTFEATSDAKEVLPDSYFEVSFLLKNANGINFKPPSFKGFKIIAGPNKSTSMQITQGQVEREMGFSFTLQPKKFGTFIIGKASIQANGKTLTSEALTIKVIKKPSNIQKNYKQEKSAYVIIEPNKTEVYPGEQVLIDYKLYTTVSLDGYDIIEEPDYKGFYAQELRRFNSRTQREVIQGKQITTKVLRRLSLFPQRSGKLVIPPAQIQLAVIEDNDRSGFFFSRNIKPVICLTDTIEIFVKDLPINAPSNFIGAVGQYEFQVNFEQNRITTDDAFSISILISGDGDIKRVQIPKLILSDSLEVYPPKIIEEKITESQGQLSGRKIIEYLIIPKYSGTHTFQPVFGYFNTNTEQYDSYTSSPISIHVEQGSDRNISPTKVIDNYKNFNDIRPIKKNGDFEKKNYLLIEPFLFIGAVCLPFLAFATLLSIKKIKETSHKRKKGTKKKQAQKIAILRLKGAHTLLKNNSNKEFYSEISKASFGYLYDKTGMSLSELSKENIHEKLFFLNVNPKVIDRFIGMIKTCETALFAGKDNSSDMLTTYNNALELIEVIEKQISGVQNS